MKDQDKTDDEKLSIAERDYFKMEFDPIFDGIANYNDTVVQYGFMMLFICALPISCFCSVVNNYFKTRINAYKVFNCSSRVVVIVLYYLIVEVLAVVVAVVVAYL